MAKARMAGKALEALKWLFKGDDAGQIALRVIPDVGFGVLEGAMTPGDLGDKIVAGSSTAVGSLAGGIGFGKLGGNSAVARQLLDLGGGCRRRLCWALGRRSYSERQRQTDRWGRADCL